MSSNAYNSSDSRIKMVVLTKPGEKNITWYNFIKHNSRSTENIIAGMKRRFLMSNDANKAQVLQFYNNETGELIEQHDS